MSSETNVFHTTTNDATKGFRLDVVITGQSVRQDEEMENSLLRTPSPTTAPAREEGDAVPVVDTILCIRRRRATK